MQRLCSGSLPAVLDLYTPRAVLVPTYGSTVLQGKAQLAVYFREFVGKRPELCGTIDNKSVVVQQIGITKITSGDYTFFWRGGKSEARFTIVQSPFGIVTHHSSESPK